MSDFYHYEVISASSRSVYPKEEGARKKFNSLKKAVLIKDNEVIEEKGGVIAFKTLMKELNEIKNNTDASTSLRIENLIKRLKTEDLVYV